MTVASFIEKTATVADRRYSFSSDNFGSFFTASLATTQRQVTLAIEGNEAFGSEYVRVGDVDLEV